MHIANISSLTFDFIYFNWVRWLGGSQVPTILQIAIEILVVDTHLLFFFPIIPPFLYSNSTNMRKIHFRQC